MATETRTFWQVSWTIIEGEKICSCYHCAAQPRHGRGETIGPKDEEDQKGDRAFDLMSAGAIHHHIVQPLSGSSRKWGNPSELPRLCYPTSLGPYVQAAGFSSQISTFDQSNTTINTTFSKPVRSSSLSAAPVIVHRSSGQLSVHLCRCNRV